MTFTSEAFMARTTISTLLLLGLVVPTPLAAQAANGLAPGSRIRVAAPTVTDARAAGSLDSIDAAALHLTLQDGGRLTVPRRAVESIEVSTGRRSHWVRGAGIGALVGLAFSGTLAIVGANQGDSELTSLDNAMYGAFIVITTAGSAVVGGITGAFIRTEQWEPVPAENVQVGVRPVAGGGLGIGVSLRF